LWAELIAAKLEFQALSLEATGHSGSSLRGMAKRVRSGDPENLEAQGARKYWSELLGKSFRRDRDAPGVNGMLNYGYTVLRAATARAVVAAGLHPTLGLHHSNEGNSMRLVDDLMEPFRPFVDLQVCALVAAGHTGVTPVTKKPLVEVLYTDLQSDEGATPVMVAIQSLATSLAQVFLGERVKLILPSCPPLFARAFMKDIPCSPATESCG
jgi:CRISP-associated protein Cas1